MIDFEDEVTDRTLERLKRTADVYLKGMIGEDYPLVVLSYLFDELKSACFVRAGLSNHKDTIKLACIIKYLPKALSKYTNYDGVIDFIDKMWFESTTFDFTAQSKFYQDALTEIIKNSNIATKFKGSPRT